MRKKKYPRTERILSAVFALLFALLACAPILEGVIVHAASPSVFIDGKMKINGNTASAEIHLNGTPSSPVTVYYHTENRSAIAGVDYKSASGSIVMDSVNATVYVYLINATAPYKTVLNKGKSNEKTYTREFALIIDRVEGDAKIDKNSNTASICSLGGKTELSLTSSGNLVYAAVYAQLATWSCSDWCIDDDTTKTKSNIFGTQVKDWGGYVKAGLAKAYTTFTISNMDHSIVSSGTDVYYWLRNSAGKDLLYFRDNTCTSGGYNLPSDKLDTAIKTQHLGHSYGDNWLDLYDISVGTNYKYLYRLGGNNGGPEACFLEVPLNDSSVDVDLTIKNTASFYHIYYTAYHYMRLVDSTRPVATNFYLDDSSLGTTGKLRLSVRFSEPVRSTAETYSSISVQLRKKDGSYYGSYDFYYAGGALTDTLYYECEIPKGRAIYGYTITSGSFDSKIVDLSYNISSTHAVVQNEALWPSGNLNVTLDKPIDYVEPSVSVEGGYGDRYATQEDLVIRTGVTGCTVYTKWDHNFSDITVPAGADPALYYDNVDYYADDWGTVTFGDDARGDGDWYLHVLAVNTYGLTDTYTSDRYRIDRSAPELSYTVLKNDNCEKVFEIKVKDKLSGLSKLEIRIDDKWYTIWDENGIDKTHVKEDGGVFTYTSDISSKGNDERISSVMSAENTDRRKFSIVFRATDKSLGPTGSNVTTTQPFSVTYDRRDNFLVLMDMDEKSIAEHEPIENVGIGIPVYNINKDDNVTGETAKIQITPIPTEKFQSTPSEYMDDVLRFYLVDENGAEHEGVKRETTTEVKWTCILDLGPGYHELTPIAEGNNGDGDFTLVSNTISFYLTDGMTESTPTAEAASGNIVLANRVYQISSEISFTYLSGTEIPTVARSNYGAALDDTNHYSGGSPLPTFSGIAAAEKYVRETEYQDFYLIKLDANQVSFLNNPGSSTTYAKADGETKTAQEGQLWIRYKRNTWTQYSDAGSWAYYFYAESGSVANGININTISANLKATVKTVTDYVLKFGKTINLVGDGYTSTATGAPYLVASQIHDRDEIFTKTRCGTLLSPSVIYEADNAIYHNTVKVNNVDYPLATNMTVRAMAGTYLYAKERSADQFMLLSPDADKDITLKRLLGDDIGAGLYVIREITSDGVCDFTVYIDTSSPTVNARVFTAGDKEGEIKTTDVPIGTGQGQVSGLRLSFIGFETEIDAEAYVVVYTFNQRNFVAAYYANDLIDGVTLQDNNYYVEIGDRSGNRFSFPVFLSETKLEPEIKENNAGTSFSIHVPNRTADEIYRYEIHLNGENLDVDKDKLLEKGDVFKEAGVYSIFIQDIYGNTFTEDYVFNYKVPEVTFYYMKRDGTFTRFTGGSNGTEPAGMTFETVGDRNYTITAATNLRFFISDVSGVPAFSVTGLKSGEYTVNENAKVNIRNAETGLTEQYTGTMVEIKVLCNFSISVYYEEHPDDVLTYTCVLDTQAPQMNGSYVAVNYVRDELSEMEERAMEAAIEENGSRVIPPYLTFSKDSGTIRSLMDGDVFSGNCITLSFTDASGIFSVKILHDGQDSGIDTSVMPITINEYGKYDVKVTDNLGNTATYTFTNDPPESGSFLCDGKSVTAGIGNTLYGHDELRLTALSNCETEILIRANGKTYYFRYLVDDGEILESFYQYAQGEGESLVIQPIVISDPVRLVLEDPAYTAGTFVSMLGDDYVSILKKTFGISADTDLNFDVLASFDGVGIASFAVVLKDGTAEVEMRNIADNGKTPAYAKAELSTEQSDVPVSTKGKDIVLPHDGTTVYVTGYLTVFPRADKEEILTVDEKVLTVDVYFSNDRNVWEKTRLYTAGENQPATYYATTEGFYRLEILNVYGNVTSVEFSLAGAFLSTSSIHYRDGMEQSVVNEEGKVTVVTSNDSVTVYAFNPLVTFTVDGEPAEVTNEQDVLSITFIYNDENVEYDVVMTDPAGNVKKVKVVIGTDPTFALSESWLTGYNGNALRKDEGYTSNKLSVDLTDGNAVAIVTVRKDGGTPVTVYNTVGIAPVTDPSLLAACVGQEGDGVYEVTFRNVYGDAVTKTVHFRETPTLELSRITSYSGVAEAFDLSDALKGGFYSNRTLIFNTSAEVYDFRIGGVSASLSEGKILEFSSSSGEGTIPYDVTYVDEYGMSYSFRAILMRKNDLLDTNVLDLKTVDSTVYTAKDIAFTLPDGLFALVSVNGAERTDYVSGTVFRADAKYAFTFVDFAGNVQTFTVIHDSVAHFTVRDRYAEDDATVINGGAVNSDAVLFSSDEGDTSFILRAFLNGVERTEDNTNLFTETGHWELLVSDIVGNTEYFAFDLLNHSLAEYHFEAPYGYTISEVWRTDADGNKQLTSGLTSDRNRKLDLVFHEGETGPLSYAVILISQYDNNAVNFTVQLDNTPPQAKLVGTEDGGDTPYEVTLTNVIGNTVEVYRDGNFVSKVLVEMQSDIPIITEGGKYEIRIANPAGVVQTFTFSKRYIANAAASVLMIVACLGIAVGVFIGLLLHHRSKTDD